jgi:uncharacterized protein YciI
VFIVSVTYQAELEDIEAALPLHREWLEQHYAEGVFVLSGRQVPRIGGVILATGVSRSDLNRRLAQDPFHLQQLATYAVVEIEPTMAVDALAFLR